MQEWKVTQLSEQGITIGVTLGGVVTAIAENQAHSTGIKHIGMHYGQLPQHEQERLEGVLHGIQRGRSLTVQPEHIRNIEDPNEQVRELTFRLQEPEDPRHRETVLEHSLAMLTMTQGLQAYSVAQGHPEGLARQIDFVTVANIIPVHDIGEGWDGGDLPRNLGSLYVSLRERFADGERTFVHQQITPGFSDPQHGDWFLDIYNRYEQREPTDIEAQLVNLIDKFQGQIFISHRGVPMSHDVRKASLKAGIEAMNRILPLLSQTAQQELQSCVYEWCMEINDPQLIEESFGEVLTSNELPLTLERQNPQIIDMGGYRRSLPQ